jgi:hypothetical protein
MHDKMEKFLDYPGPITLLMARKVDVKLFGYYPEASCNTCSNYYLCGGQAHRDDDGTVKALLDAYGDRIQVALVNVFSNEMKDFPAVADCIRQHGLRVPIVTVNGELKLFGSEATLPAIKQAVDEQLNKGPLSFLTKRS